ncbi:MAG TPA: hypothetical protein VGB97_01615 [Candidatus Paceibacterota bacterium]|jgi:hypothetical protein
MSDLQFNEERGSYRSGTSASGMAGWLTRSGFVKNACQANVLMATVAVLALAASAWLLSVTGDATRLTPEQERTAAWMAEGRLGAPPASYTPAP